MGRSAGAPRRGAALSGRRTDLDEDDVRVRPGRGSRPRTRRRPGHEQAEAAMVLAVDRGRYTCLVDGREAVAMRARELGRRGVVVGDRVRVVGDTSGDPDALARIVRVEPRVTTLRRTADDTDPVERVVVANADQLVVVASLADPAPRLRFVDRCLVAAFDAGLAPLLCLTKADLARPEPVLERYAALDLTAVTARHDEAPGELADRLAHRVSVLIGHSGVGKSTLVNRLVPMAGRVTGGVSAIGKGRHTSSSVVALALPDGGWVVDTPGIRSFGLAHVRPTTLLRAFPDLAPGAAGCPPACGHGTDDPTCALDAWVAESHATPARLVSYRRLLEARVTDSPD